MPGAVGTVEGAAVGRSAARGEWWLLDRFALAWSALSALILYALIGRGHHTAINALRLDTTATGSCIFDVRIGIPTPTD